MPISKEKRAAYPENWKQIRANILNRAAHRCEKCQAKNHAMIARGTRDEAHGGTYMVETGEVYNDQTGEYLGMCRGSEYDADRFVTVVLTISHQDRDVSNNNESNLKALCQQCHLRHYAKLHAINAAVTRARKLNEQSRQCELFE